jgi:hypothetical protein
MTFGMDSAKIKRFSEASSFHHPDKGDILITVGANPRMRKHKTFQPQSGLNHDVIVQPLRG